VRFIKEQPEGHTVREEFLQFQKATELSGAGLAKQILSNLEKHGLDPAMMVGQGYDGASAMSGCTNGVQALIREKAPAAIYVHCSSHTLNLVLNSTCSIPEIRNMFGTVRESITFINDSVKRRTELEAS
jgi:hypothetical protein